MNRKITITIAVFFLFFPLELSAGARGGSPRGIITAQELHAQLNMAGSTPPVLLHVGWGGPEEEYNNGHIPSAIHVNTDEIEYDLFKARSTTPAKKLGRSTTPEQDQAKGLSPDDSLPRNWWNIYPDRYLLPALANMGVTVDSSVVIYAKDPTAAARLAWTMLYAGVEDVKILDGGITGWERAGYTLSREPFARISKMNFGTLVARHPEYLVNIPFVRNAIITDDQSFVLADIRTQKEYEGKSAPYSYIPSKGRIKNAVWGKAGKGPWSMEYYINDDGTFRDLAEVEMMWAEQGITADKHVAFYCGTAWRSSLAFYFAYMMGWEKISNFDSSWYEWSLGPEAAQNPIE